MEISLDPARRALTLAERGRDVADAVRVVGGPGLTVEDRRVDDPARRLVTYGLPDGRMVAVIRTETTRGRRIMSMREAKAREQARYGKQLG